MQMQVYQLFVFQKMQDMYKDRSVFLLNWMFLYATPGEGSSIRLYVFFIKPKGPI